MKPIALFLFVIIGFFSSCSTQVKDEPVVVTEKKENIGNDLQIAKIDTAKLAVVQKVYVPIYSEIYVINAKTKCLLTATLSIRNTSIKDTLYLKHVDYYDSQGNIKHRYIKQSVLLTPLESIEYVVEYTEKEGGAGANFIVEWGSTKGHLKPIVQAVMIGSTASQQGISFLTDGVEIE